MHIKRDTGSGKRDEMNYAYGARKVSGGYVCAHLVMLAAFVGDTNVTVCNKQKNAKKNIIWKANVAIQ